MDFVHRQSGAAGNVNDYAGSALNVGLEKRALNSLTHGVEGTVLAFTFTDTDMGVALVLHDGLDIGEVEVDERRGSNDLGYALYTLTEHVVRHLERLHERGALRNEKLYLFVGDNEQGIHYLLQFLDTFVGSVHTRFAFELLERLGNYRDGEDIHFFSHLSDDGSRSRSGTASHTRGYEQQIGILEMLSYLLFALLRRARSDLRISARSESLGQICSELDLYGGFAHVERLHIGVGCYERAGGYARQYHTVDGVVAASAHSDNLNIGYAVGIRHYFLFLPKNLSFNL